jgi:hypothetical protein
VCSNHKEKHTSGFQLVLQREHVTTQDFVKFWKKKFAFVLLEMIEISQGFKTF